MRYAVALRGTLRLRIGNELFSRRPPARRGGRAARVSTEIFSEADVAGEKQLHVAVSWTRGSKVHASKQFGRNTQVHLTSANEYSSNQQIRKELLGCLLPCLLVFHDEFHDEKKIKLLLTDFRKGFLRYK